MIWWNVWIGHVAQAISHTFFFTTAPQPNRNRCSLEKLSGTILSQLCKLWAILLFCFLLTRADSIVFIKLSNWNSASERIIRGYSLHLSRTRSLCVCEHHEVFWCDCFQKWQRDHKWFRSFKFFVFSFRCYLKCEMFTFIPFFQTFIFVEAVVRKSDNLMILIFDRVLD